MIIGFNKLAKVLFIVCSAFFISNLMQPLKANAQSSPPPVTAGSGQLLLKNSDQQGQYINALSLQADAEISISGLIAHTTLTQSFRNESEHWLEGLYVFPLAAHASVSAMEIRFAGNVITAKIKEKQQAKVIYERAKNAGKVAALTEQDSPNLFRQQVANIPPGETVHIRLVVEQTLSYQDAKFSYRLPMTFVPRYSPQTLSVIQQQAIAHELAKQTADITVTDGWATAPANTNTEEKPAVEQANRPQFRGNPIPKMQVSIKLQAGAEIAQADLLNHSQTDSNKIEITGDVLTLTETFVMDQDFILEWRLIGAKTPQAALFHQQKAIDGTLYQHHLLMLMPPQQLPTLPRLPKERIFVIDTSGSMHGEAITQAKAALQKGLGQLSQHDTFNVIAFSSNAQALFSQSQAVTESNIRHANHWVTGLQANGGTEMASALAMALAPDAESGIRVRQVIFITDGAVSNEQALFAQIRRDVGRSKLFTVGIGHAPNDYFMRGAAEYGGGQHIFISQTEQVDERLAQLFNKLSSPVLTNIQISSDSATAELSIEQVKDLYLGEPIFVAMRTTEASTLRVTGFGIDEASSQQALWQQSFSLSQSKAHQGIANHWARRTIDKIERQKLAGVDKASRKQQVLPLALGYQLLSPYTAFVAVEETQVKPADAPLQRVKLNNAVKPAMKSLAFPKTATDSLTWAYWFAVLGLLALAQWLFIKQIQRQPVTGKG